MTQIVIHDFTRMIDAKSLALELITSGVQFTFCPQPLSISYPRSALPAKTAQEDQAP